MTLAAALNAEAAAREELEAKHGQVWSTQELTRDFEVLWFLAPAVKVRRKSDKQEGYLFFQDKPRFYWDFVPIKEW